MINFSVGYRFILNFHIRQIYFFWPWNHFFQSPFYKIRVKCHTKITLARVKTRFCHMIHESKSLFALIPKVMLILLNQVRLFKYKHILKNLKFYLDVDG